MLYYNNLTKEKLPGYHQLSRKDPIGNLDITNIKITKHLRARTFEGRFISGVTFNQPVGGWDVQPMTNLNSLFGNVTIFNQPIGDWNVSKVIDMAYLFSYNTRFNQPIGDWDISSVVSMRYMFNFSRKFNQDLSNWVIGFIVDTTGMFEGCSIAKKYKPKGVT